MRLYAKLAAIVLIALAVQWGLKRGPIEGANFWFAARCHCAHVINDEQWLECLIQEAQAFRDCPEMVMNNAPQAVAFANTAARLD
jgi:hypothetical protein